MDASLAAVFTGVPVNVPGNFARVAGGRGLWLYTGIIIDARIGRNW
ncbi:hypothetical protein [Moorella sulfitireducens (nom. illeg.)]|nr:hypothetical protein [Moorella sulfitireducens]